MTNSRKIFENLFLSEGVSEIGQVKLNDFPGKLPQIFVTGSCVRNEVRFAGVIESPSNGWEQ